MQDYRIGQKVRPRLSGRVTLGVLLVVLLFGSRYIASFFIDYGWWSELGQMDTWLNQMLYGIVPVILAAVLCFACFWTAYKLGQKQQISFGSKYRTLYNRIAFGVLALVAWLVASATVDNWTVVRFFGSLRLPANQAGYIDPIFGKPLPFYFFDLPFYSLLLHVVLVAAIVSLLVYWVAAHVEDLVSRISTLTPGGGPGAFPFDHAAFSGTLNSQFARLVVAVFLLGLAVKFYLNRYDILYVDHGLYLVGADWVADHIVLPLQWLMVFSAIVAAVLVMMRQNAKALVLLFVVLIRYLLPPIVTAVYVRPNELALERPYIQDHIRATRSAYKLDQRVKETQLAAEPEIRIDYAKHKPLLDNVRLWDWRAFHDTITQIQPLRPYVFLDTDVDRYTIDGQLRQLLIAPRELEISQLGEARSRWINPHFIYTHGYGIVMAEANKISRDGLPSLLIKDAPPEVSVKGLKFARPQIYYGEVAHEPVFVDTNQPEFEYPSAPTNVPAYSGKGGFPISSPFMRLAAALQYADLNILLTNNFKANSRMMIHRRVMERISMLAGFIDWDQDPYLVLTDKGQLVWIIDGYMSSASHPYSRGVDISDRQSANYLRNSVKATVDAYTGETNFYVFDPSDVLVQAYWRLFPELFKPESAMPADLRAHARYPETLFNAQAEMYRSFHMLDAEAFYNRADLWDLAKTSTKGEAAQTAASTYIVGALPGEARPEFLLVNQFTPANKGNLIGQMVARCDGEHLGELVFQQLNKQNVIFGPMQIEARINQDQVISKDLTLWNQQGSKVLMGQTLVLPIENSFLYVAPIYIQAQQASMPQLKKVALAMGNRLAYADTYEQALGQLIDSLQGGSGSTQDQQNSVTTNSSSPQQQGSTPTSNATAQTPSPVQELQEIRDHLRRYRELNGQGKLAEAGRELEQIQKLIER